MKRKVSQMIIFSMLLLIGGLLNIQTIRAASANVEITADENQVEVGNTIYVYINISSDTMFGDVEANLTYDEDILEYKGGVSFITGSSGFLKIADINFSEGAENRKYALEFKALEVGKNEIKFNGTIMVYDYTSGYPMSVSSNKLELEVIAPHTASDNAYLKSLKISPTDLEPSFDKNTFEYDTSVGYETEKLVVVALPEDEKATIRVKGNDSLLEGENKVIVTVIAESGNKTEYTVNVFRESTPVDIDTEPITPNKKHGSFEVLESDNERYLVYGGKYKLIEIPADLKIPSGYTKTRIIISDTSIEVFSPEQLDSEFLLVYAENELGQVGFYQFDKIERTMQRYAWELPIVQGPIDNIDDDLIKSQQYKSNLSKAAITIAILSAMCILLMLLSIKLYIKTKEKKKKRK